MIPSLAYAPPERMDEFVVCTGGFFITLGRQRREPLFPIPNWNLFHRVLDDDDKTNNYVEAAHLSLSKHFSSDHPKIWKFLDGLQKIQVCTNKIIYTGVSFTSSVHLIFCCFVPLERS